MALTTQLRARIGGLRGPGGTDGVDGGDGVMSPATGSEVDTGTNNAKSVTPLALADSSVIETRAAIYAGSWSGVAATIDTGYYYHKTTGVKTANANYRGFKVAVVETNSYRASTLISGSSTTLSVAVYYAVDGTTVLGSEFAAPGAGVYTGYTDQALTLPAGTAYIAINSHITNSSVLRSVPELQVLTPASSTQGETNTLAAAEIAALRQWIAQEATEEAGYYYARQSGAKTASGSYKLETYTLDGTEAGVRVTAYVSGSLTAGVTFLDGSDVVLGYALPGLGAGPVQYTDEVLDVPKLARKVIISTPTGSIAFGLEVNKVPVADEGAAAALPLALAVIFGDSITNTGVMSLADQTPGSPSYTPAVSWVTHSLPYLATSWRNYARAGATFTAQPADTATDPFKEGCTQVDTAIAATLAADCIIFALGTNDMQALHATTITLGSYATAMAKAIGSLDKSIIYDAIRYCLYKSAEEWPEAYRFIMTPIQRTNTDHENDYMIANIVTPIQEMAREYGFTVIDQFGESGIAREFEVSGGAGQDLSDGTHPYENVGATLGVGKMARLALARVMAQVNP